MRNRGCTVTIIAQYLSKNWEGNSKYNVKTSVGLMTRNHHRKERTIIRFMPTKDIFMSTKTMSNALQWLQNELFLSNLKKCVMVMVVSLIPNWVRMTLLSESANWCTGY